MMEENRAAPFLTKIYAIVDDSSTDNIVSWSAGNNSFFVKDPHEFALYVLPCYFKHCNFSSFVRQLNTYGFRKVDPDRWEFAHECFLRGQKQLLNRIYRRRSTHDRIRRAGSQFWVNCDLEGKLQRLQKDEDNIALEVVQLKEEQESIDRELGDLKRRLDVAERRPQQILSFLAAVADNPGLFRAGLSDGKKRRRLPYVEHKKNIPNLEMEGLGTKTSIADRFMPSTNASIGDGFEDIGLRRNGLIVGGFKYSPIDMSENQSSENSTQKSEFKIDVSCGGDDLGMGDWDGILW